MISPFRSVGLAVLALPVAIALAVVAGLATGDEVYWACNCCSSVTWTGNNHFDKDVFFAHGVTLSSLFWLGLTGELHRFLRVEGLVFFALVPLGLAVSALSWCAVISPAPGCSPSM